MNPIDIKVIPHSEQRYPTVGDYWNDGEHIRFRVSKMGDWRYEFLVAFHELIEWSLCKQRHITIPSIDAFDKAYERAREQKVRAPCGCTPTEESEPGFDVHAPYYHEHVWATRFERVMALLLRVNWKHYAHKVTTL